MAPFSSLETLSHAKDREFSRKSLACLDSTYVTVYNELLAVLAPQGKDYEFLSIWNEARESVSRILKADWPQWASNLIGNHTLFYSPVSYFVRLPGYRRPLTLLMNTTKAQLAEHVHNLYSRTLVSDNRF
jgi:hypothetical protein